MKQTQAELPRVLNASHAMSIVVGIIIGSGIFLVPREMMAAVGSSGMVYAVWIAGGLLSLFGAMTYAEIAAARPKYGGEYAFLRDAYGDLTGFLYMWTQITVAKPASLATIAAGLARVLATFAVFSSFDHPAFAHLPGDRSSLSPSPGSSPASTSSARATPPTYSSSLPG